MASRAFLRMAGACALLAALPFVGCTSGPAGAQAKLGPYCGKGDAGIPGRYTLEGVPEVGSQLVMGRDGSFEFYLAYGANDQHATGCWTQNGDIIALFPAGSTTLTVDHTPDTRGFKGLILRKEGADLVWEIAGSHYRGRYRK